MRMRCHYTRVFKMQSYKWLTDLYDYLDGFIYVIEGSQGPYAFLELRHVFLETCTIIFKSQYTPNGFASVK
ncbi:hypothetical protein DVH24_004261 [Malus domestica]|uniref:Uncharacterized protein n=1 Tax=Malus domestica TaxID=3750 RepID=A0A498K5S9_MALDO|nr:hypothetical protein DVH24_004261 [Malus domestica]